MAWAWYYYLWITFLLPELNLIEILWRFIKYEWIEIDAYSSWQTFVASVENILKTLGISM
jgi:transposase